MQISAAVGVKVSERSVLVWKVLHQIQRNGLCLHLGSTPRPTLASKKEGL